VGPLGVPLAEPVTRPVTADALMCCGIIGTLQCTGGSQQLRGSWPKISPDQGSTIVITNDARGNKPPSNYQNYHCYTYTLA